MANNTQPADTYIALLDRGHVQPPLLRAREGVGERRVTARGVLGAGEEVGELLLIRRRARAALDLRDGAVDLHGARVEAGLEAVLGEVAGVRVDLLLGAVVRVLDAARGVGVVEFGLGVVVVLRCCGVV